MKTYKFFACALAAAAVLTGCNKNEETGVQSVTLDQTTLTVEVGQTAQLTATVTPEGAAEVVWSSANPENATVDATGMVTGVAEGNAIIVATAGDKTANCMVKVVAEGQGEGGDEPGGNTGDLHPSLQGSDYFIFQMDEITMGKISSKVQADFRENKTTQFLYIWDATYVAGETQGLNFYGEPEGWVSLTVSSVGWSGFAYSIGGGGEGATGTDFTGMNKLADIMNAPEDYYFHIALKSTSTGSHLLFFDGTVGSGKACIGSASFTDAGVTYQPVADFTRDGAWHEIEIPMSDLLDQGLVYGSDNLEAKNLFGMLSGGVQGTNIQYDAAFIYKKAATAE